MSRQSAHEGGKVVSPTHRPPLSPRNYSWYSFLLEAESTPGPQCGRKDYANKNSSDTIGNRTSDLPACSTVPQSAAPSCTVDVGSLSNNDSVTFVHTKLLVSILPKLETRR
jgi:hypothetical protein